jgi:hypothetical protein
VRHGESVDEIKDDSTLLPLLLYHNHHYQPLPLLCNRFPAFSLSVGPSPDYLSSYLDPYTIGDDLIELVDVEDPEVKCADDVVRKYVHMDIPLYGTTPLWRCVYYPPPPH